MNSNENQLKSIEFLLDSNHFLHIVNRLEHMLLIRVKVRLIPLHYEGMWLYYVRLQ